MPESRSHKVAANRIARKLHTEYVEGSGADVQTPTVAVEVETAHTAWRGIKGLQGHRKRVYIAGTNKRAVARALHHTEGTTIGVLDNQGRIVKSSSRRPRHRTAKR